MRYNVGMAKPTSSKTIDLNCPGCDALLELDRGFAGGVCRCSTCATLMTVPKLASEKAERLVRAERPGEPAESPRSERPERPERPGASASTSFTRSAVPAPRDRPERTTAAVRAGSDDRLYRTASGREVRVDERRVPMAEAKRKAIRAATVVVFVAVIGGVLGLCGLAAYLLVTQPTAEEIAAARYVETFTYDASANPYAIEAPNLLGLPLSNRVAVVLDSAGIHAGPRAALGGVLVDGLSRQADAVRVSVFVAENGGSVQTLVHREPLDAVNAGAVGAAWADTADSGVSPLGAAVELAMADQPGIVIVVVGRELNDEETDVIAALIPEEGVRFDALLIDVDSFALEDLARRTGGHYVTLDSEFDLVGWQPVE